jgi:uncharacterized repeat protein (TIGR03803 family)
MKNIYRTAALSLVVLSLAGFTASAQTVTLLHRFSFNTSKGKGPVSRLIADEHGALYGTTYEGGANGYGTVFKLTPPASNGARRKETVLYSFCSRGECLDGSYPTGGLIFGAEGALYGTTQYGGLPCGNSGCGTVFILSPPKNGHTHWTHDVIHYFQPFPSDPGIVVDGTNPTAGLIADQQGVLYGTTNGGGLCGYVNGSGTVFKLVPDTGHGWKETVINVFCGSGIGDGADPTGGLIFDAEGALYGTTEKGGANGYGTVFKMTPPGKDDAMWPETVLYSFAGGSDGAYPLSGLVADNPSGGGLYGTTTYGGANCDVTEGCGTVFKLSPPASDGAPWAQLTLHSFSYNSSDGQYPVGGVIFGEDGNLYGTTEYGGVSTTPPSGCGLLYRCGTIFKLANGCNLGECWTETVIHKFCEQSKFCNNGAYPTAGLLARQGALYGTTSSDGDGTTCDCGTVFKLD